MIRFLAWLATLTYLAFALFSVATMMACTDETNTTRELRSSGFTDIETTGYSWFECGKGDAYHTGFRAKNGRGEVVEGTVCCDFVFKGCTVRF